MIIEIRAKNCYAFENEITFSMKADMRYKKFGTNVHKVKNFICGRGSNLYNRGADA